MGFTRRSGHRGPYARRRAVLLSALFTAGLCGVPARPTLAATAINADQQLLGSLSGGSAYYGASVALSGSTAVVGSHHEIVGGFSTGAVYVYVRSGLTWTQQERLVATDRADADWFGTSVAISGDTVVVGAPGEDGSGTPNSGAAYVFTRTGTTWTQVAKLTATAPATGDAFGASVAIDGATAAVGAPSDDIGGAPDQGSVQAFSQAGTTWSAMGDLLTADDGYPDADAFGTAVAIDGTTVLVGAPGARDGFASMHGLAYPFAWSGTAWVAQGVLHSGEGSTYDDFGRAVALDGDSALIGAPRFNGGTNRGAAYVFGRSGDAWTKLVRLQDEAGVNDDEFGAAVALAGGDALVGAYRATAGAYRGYAHRFTGAGATWTQQATLTFAGAAADDRLGTGVALADGWGLAGAPYDDVSATVNQGAAYLYRLDTTAPVTGAMLSPEPGPRATWVPGDTRLGLVAHDDGSGVETTKFRRVGDHMWNTYSRLIRLAGEGELEFEFSSVDRAGNVENPAPTFTVHRDDSAPVTAVSGVPAGWVTGDVTVTLAATDLYSGVASTDYRRSGEIAMTRYTAPITVDVEGETRLIFHSTDKVGNVEVDGEAIVRIDRTAPTTTATGIPAGWVAGPVTVDFTATDVLSGMSGGAARTEFSTDGGATWTIGASAIVATQGETTLRYRSVDAAGNVEAATSATIRIDGTAPTTTATGVPAGWSRSPVTVNLVAVNAQAGMSGGAARTEYSTNNGATWLAGATVTIATQGATTLLFRSLDAVGNPEAAGSATVRIDSRAPTTRATAASVRKGKKVSLPYHVRDAMPGSGRATVIIRIYKGTKRKATITVAGTVTSNAAHSIRWRCNLKKGKYTIRVHASDLAGNRQSKVGTATLTVR